MKKRLLCFALGLTLGLSLCLTPALAAVEDKFPSLNSYPGYADVGESHWAYSNVKLCYEVGLMNGTDNGFEPETVLPISQCAVVAARMREAITGEAIPMPTEGEVPWPWYAPYLTYLENVAENDPSLGYALPILAAPESPASRQDFLYLLNLAAAEESFPTLNNITSLPDTADELVLRFYNVGILTGMDAYGTFNAAGTLSRAECAAMVSRIIRPELRQHFTPKPAGDAGGGGAASGGAGGETASDESVMTVNGIAVGRNLFVDILNGLIYDQDASLYMQTGQRLDWDDPDLADLKYYFLNAAVDEAVRYSVLTTKSSALGCTVEDLPAVLSPDPGRNVLNAYAQENDLLCAKHILVEDMDSANAVLSGLKTTPTLEQFDALVSVFNTDPGMTNDPNGYLFTGGEMVSEFENAVRELAVGSYTAEPVQSQFGYHIIWRLEPASHPQLLEEYQYSRAMEQLDAWLHDVEVVLDTEKIESIDPRACYEAFLAG